MSLILAPARSCKPPCLAPRHLRHTHTHGCAGETGNRACTSLGSLRQAHLSRRAPALGCWRTHWGVEPCRGRRDDPDRPNLRCGPHERARRLWPTEGRSRDCTAVFLSATSPLAHAKGRRAAEVAWRCQGGGTLPTTRPPEGSRRRPETSRPQHAAANATQGGLRRPQRADPGSPRPLDALPHRFGGAARGLNRLCGGRRSRAALQARAVLNRRVRGKQPSPQPEADHSPAVTSFQFARAPTTGKKSLLACLRSRSMAGRPPSRQPA